MKSRGKRKENILVPSASSQGLSRSGEDIHEKSKGKEPMIVSCLNRKESLGPRDSMQESHAMVSHVTSTLDPNFHSMVCVSGLRKMKSLMPMLLCR